MESLNKQGSVYCAKWFPFAVRYDILRPIRRRLFGELNILGFRNYSLGVFLAAGLIACGSSAGAQNLPELLENLVQSHERIKAAKQDLAASENRVRVAKGDWFPELDVSADSGWQKRQNPGTNDTTRHFNDVTVSVTQLLWDFGKTNSAIDISKKTRDSSMVQVTRTRQELLLDAIAAYIQVFSAHQRVTLAKKSEDNVKRQTELEDARVSGGAGFSTDVLQAKTELAEAQTRRVVAEGSLRTATSRYHSLFREFPRNLDQFKLPAIPEALLPETLDEAIKTALTDNPELRVDRMTAEISQKEIARTRQDSFFPEINAVIESNLQENVDGTAGTRVDNTAKFELSFPFNLGLTASDSVDAASNNYNAAAARAGDKARTIEEQVRLAWADLQTQRENHEVRTAQIEIAGKFLELAREEREAGRRSLLDVLSGETRLINAQSDAIVTEVAIVQAAYRLLSTIGRLEISAVALK
jgi:outer membrane protein, adhesin transport system